MNGSRPGFLKLIRDTDIILNTAELMTRKSSLKNLEATISTCQGGLLCLHKLGETITPSISIHLQCVQIVYRPSHRRVIHTHYCQMSVKNHVFSLQPPNLSLRRFLSIHCFCFCYYSSCIKFYELILSKYLEIAMSDRDV